MVGSSGVLQLTGGALGSYSAPRPIVRLNRVLTRSPQQDFASNHGRRIAADPYRPTFPHRGASNCHLCGEERLRSAQRRNQPREHAASPEPALCDPRYTRIDRSPRRLHALIVGRTEDGQAFPSLSVSTGPGLIRLDLPWPAEFPNTRTFCLRVITELTVCIGTTTDYDGLDCTAELVGSPRLTRPLGSGTLSRDHGTIPAGLRHFRHGTQTHKRGIRIPAWFKSGNRGRPLELPRITYGVMTSSPGHGRKNVVLHPVNLAGPSPRDAATTTCFHHVVTHRRYPST
ncbi:hypothetical protein R1flu_019581 [Riccia fluitans]|uniref:Uncharacterized protein n=1 Tax=Riccia fluitans TaxID=41844 RepID=A0ABD1ZJ90_9MARC